MQYARPVIVSAKDALLWFEPASDGLLWWRKSISRPWWLTAPSAAPANWACPLVRWPVSCQAHLFLRGDSKVDEANRVERRTLPERRTLSRSALNKRGFFEPGFCSEDRFRTLVSEEFAKTQSRLAGKVSELMGAAAGVAALGHFLTGTSPRMNSSMFVALGNGTRTLATTVAAAQVTRTCAGTSEVTTTPAPMRPLRCQRSIAPCGNHGVRPYESILFNDNTARTARVSRMMARRLIAAPLCISTASGCSFSRTHHRRYVLPVRLSRLGGDARTVEYSLHPG